MEPGKLGHMVFLLNPTVPYVLPEHRAQTTLSQEPPATTYLLPQASTTPAGGRGGFSSHSWGHTWCLLLGAMARL